MTPQQIRAAVNVITAAIEAAWDTAAFSEVCALAELVYEQIDQARAAQRAEA